MNKYIFLLLLYGCGVTQPINSDTRIKYPFLTSGHASIIVMVDVYNPISYNLYFNSSKQLISIVFITHHYNRQLPPITKSVVIENANKIFEIPLFNECSTYIDYQCLGLDGSELWIKYEDGSIRKFWNPSSQPNTIVGSQYLELLSSLREVVEIESLKKEFLSNLPSGQYWNFGEGLISK